MKRILTFTGSEKKALNMLNTKNMAYWFCLKFNQSVMKQISTFIGTEKVLMTLNKIFYCLKDENIQEVTSFTERNLKIKYVQIIRWSQVSETILLSRICCYLWPLKTPKTLDTILWPLLVFQPRSTKLAWAFYGL